MSEGWFSGQGRHLGSDSTKESFLPALTLTISTLPLSMRKKASFFGVLPDRGLICVFSGKKGFNFDVFEKVIMIALFAHVSYFSFFKESCSF